ncbi:allantoinase [Tieghemostelium lacteum]|uniref:allantoinase n=1 Tax=Tieghemostelium lacteum TaxID=361077 RepID=A0A152AA35_TIELA|nr:allantoinase [Tieghemostelium lacteum]|eukprot:KYR03080.1 allantoinase [Tieghemostelium lacteum]
MDIDIGVIRGRNIVIEGEVRSATVFIRDGVIFEIKPYHTKLLKEWNILFNDEGMEEEIVIMGGLVDCHVHVNEPGRTEWEGWVSATNAAAAGGVTTICDMPLNSIPVTTTYQNLLDKIDSMKGKCRVDVGLLGGIVPGNAGEIKKMVTEGGVVGFKSFLVHSGIDDFQAVRRDDIQKAMDVMKELQQQHKDVVMMFHAEVPEPIDEMESVVKDMDPRVYNTFLTSRPRKAENLAIDLVIDMAKQNQVKSHIVHLSSSDAIKALEHAITVDKVPITAETTFHYLFFVSEEVPDGNTLYKCCPPVRENENKELLWQALQNKTIAMVVSDHSPCTPNLKLLDQGDFMKAWGGISSLQLGLSIVWTEAKKRGIPFSIMSQIMCDEPAKLVNINDRKGSIKVGRDADFVIWAPNQSFTVDQSTMLVKNQYSPYHSSKLYGKVQLTILRGQVIFRHDQTVEEYKNTPTIGQRVVPTRVHSSPHYPNPFLPSIDLLNSLEQDDFFASIHLLFELAPVLAEKVYQARPFSSYEALVQKAEEIINNLEEAMKLPVINAHPRIGLNPNETLSSLSYQEQGNHNENQLDPEIVKVYKELAELNEQYEKKFGFKFVVFVNGRSKAEIVPVLKQRLLNTDPIAELNLGLSEMIEIAYSRLKKLLP